MISFLVLMIESKELFLVASLSVSTPPRVSWAWTRCQSPIGWNFSRFPYLMVTDSGRGAARAEDTQGTPTKSHMSPSILLYKDNYEDESLIYWLLFR